MCAFLRSLSAPKVAQKRCLHLTHIHTHIHLWTRSKQAPFFAHTKIFRTHFLNNSNWLLGSPSSSRQVVRNGTDNHVGHYQLVGPKPIFSSLTTATTTVTPAEPDTFDPIDITNQSEVASFWIPKCATTTTAPRSQLHGAAHSRALHGGENPTELTRARDSCGARIDTKLGSTRRRR